MSEIALIGKKIGMTREFYKTGQLVPVTVLKVEKARVIQVIDEEKRGYKAVQLGYGKIKNSKLTKAMKGFFAKKNTEAKKTFKEYRVKDTENYKEGNEFGLEIFKDIKFVDTRSKTIGKGFAGAMKRWNFGGLRASHGVSVSHRARKAPIFVGGGIAHGPKGELAYKKRKLNKNEKKLSVASLITEKNKDKNLLILNDFSSEIKKTKEMNAIIQKLEIPNSLIILDKASKEKIEKSARNIPNVKVTDVNHFSSYDIIKFKKVVFTESSVKELEKRYS
jgi:50S ribosomal protein uL3/50S ribosomal protein L4